MEKYKHIKISILLIDICIFLLMLFVFFLPYAITWYAEVMGRGPKLATTVMVTCYPCVPFGWTILISMRRFLKQVLKGNLFTQFSVDKLKIICICCIVIAAITVVAGNFYMPFFIVGGTFMFLSLISFSLRAVIKTELTDSMEVEELTEETDNPIAETDPETTTKETENIQNSED